MKKSLSERDICTKFITPAVVRARWEVLSQIREEMSFTKGRIIVRGKAKRTDYILYHQPNIPIVLWRMWKAGRKKRGLFLTGHSFRADQVMVKDFRPCGAAMAKRSTH